MFELASKGDSASVDDRPTHDPGLSALARCSVFSSMPQPAPQIENEPQYEGAAAEERNALAEPVGQVDIGHRPARGTELLRERGCRPSAS